MPVMVVTALKQTSPGRFLVEFDGAEALRSTLDAVTDARLYVGMELEDEAFEAAKRELQEETGDVSDNWKHLMTIPANATLASNYVHIYMATDLALTISADLSFDTILSGAMS